MTRKTVRLTMAQALVRYLCNQFTEIEGERVPLFAGVFAIFGHGNVTCLSEALETVQDTLPTWRGQIGRRFEHDPDTAMHMPVDPANRPWR